MNNISKLLSEGFKCALFAILVLFLIATTIANNLFSHENEVIPIGWKLATSPSAEHTCFIREGYNEVYSFPLITRVGREQADEDICKQYIYF